MTQTLRYLLLCCIFMLASSGAQALKKVNIELKWFHQFQFAGIYAAKEKGFYQQVGLDVDILERNLKSSPVDDVLSGKVQFGISDSTIVLNRMQGKKVVLLAAFFQHSPLVLITLAKNKIFSPLELKNKKVMYQKNVDDAVITAMLSAQGVQKNEFMVVPHTFKDNALLTDNIDAMSAYLGDQTHFYAKNGIDINIINPMNYGIDLYGDLLFTSEAYLKNNMDTALKFRKATIKGWRYALNHPDEIIELIINKYGSNKSKAQLQHEAKHTKLMIRPDLIEVGHINYGRFKHIQQIYKTWGNGLTDSDISGLFYADYLKVNKKHFANKMLFVFLGALSLAVFSSMIAILLKRRKNKLESRLNTTSKKFFDFQKTIMHEFPTTMTNEQGVITYVSDSMLACLGYPREELIGKSKMSFYLSDDVLALRSLIRTSIANKGCWKGELVLRDKQGAERHFDTLVNEYFEPNGKKVGYVSVHVDRTQRKQAERLATTDTLTGLANRYQLDEKLKEYVQQKKRYGTALSAILIDIDHFKSINDSLGHIEGDKVLKNAAELMAAHCRETDTVGRWGGEEFLILCPNTLLECAACLAEKLRALVANNLKAGDKPVTISAGVSMLLDSDGPISFIERIDNALYDAKASGRDQVKAE